MACKDKPITAEEDDLPDLPHLTASDDEYQAESYSSCSPTDWNDIESFMQAHADQDADIHYSSDQESAESQGEESTCTICLKPPWRNSYKASNYHCRDYCTHHGENHTTDEHKDAPRCERATTMPCMASILMPPEVEEIASKTKRPWSKKKLKRWNDGEIHSMPAALAVQEHREKEESAGDQLNPLIAWYSLVAKPIPRKLWASMPRAQASIDAEWQKLRDCDDGKGTWDESEVREYWDVKHEAKMKLDKTGVHTHFGSLFDLCVEKGSELEEAKRRYKGRVVFGGRRIHDEFGLAAEFPEQGSGASMISASKPCGAVSMLPGCDGEQSDATSAYTHSKLGTGMEGPYIVTWVELPTSQWKHEWVAAGMTRPVC
jgi:hypothetical protein